MSDRQLREALVTTLRCLECRAWWTDLSERWRIYLMKGDPATLLVYCQDCAAREFDS